MYANGCEAPLDRDRWCSVWVDGMYSGLRGSQAKLCALVVIGLNADGEKHFLAIEDGVREFTQSWREVLLKLKSRGMNVPELAIGDGAMGFWAALEEVYPESRRRQAAGRTTGETGQPGRSGVAHGGEYRSQQQDRHRRGTSPAPLAYGLRQGGQGHRPSTGPANYTPC